MVEPENTKELAESIINLLSNNVKAKRMGELGRQFIIKNYSRKEIAAKIAANVDVLTNHT